MARVGIGVGAESVRVILTDRSGAVRWHTEIPREDRGSESLTIALRSALARIPGRKWPRRRTVAALGPHCAQVRLLAELPPLGRAVDIARVIHESSHRFFLRNGVPLITGGVRPVDERSAWAVAFEQPVVQTVIACCREARLRLVAIVPSAAVLHAGIIAKHVTWIDGATCSELMYESSSLRAVTRAPADTATTSLANEITPNERLAALGQDAWRYADALGAVTLGAREPLRLQGSTLSARESRVPAWRRAASLTAAALALLTAILAPGLRAWHTEITAERELRAMAAERRGVALTSRELERVTGALAEGTEFVRHRRSHLTLLASLTTTLPGDAWIMAIKTDSTGGHLVTLSDRAAGVLAVMDSVAGIAGAALLGPVTREVVGTREMERATIRFHWSEDRP